MSQNKEQLYNEKVSRILTSVSHQEPDKVPILTMFGTWAVSYANMTITDIENDPEKEIEAFCKPHEDIYSDATYTNGIAFDAKSARILGSKSHFISEDGSTIQHKEITPMEAHEYPELIADPMKYIFNKMIPRKAENLNKTPQENLKALRELIEHWKVKSNVQGRLLQELKTRHGMPVLAGSFIYPCMDFVFDYLRGFKGISIDIRRRPDELLEGINALEALQDEILGIVPGTEKVNDFPFFATMMHIPTFINPKQFEKFFWPTYERACKKVHALGGKLVIFLEGNWENKYEYLNSLPKDFAIGILEEDDVFNAKKKIGDNITIAGGMPSSMLRLNSKKECIDHAKRVLDECAPGGGFIFSSDRELLSKRDINVENLIAVNEYVHNYGIYK